MPDPTQHRTAAHILRGSAIGYVLIGGAIAAWLLDKAIRVPEIQASQFGFTAPLWIPATVFVVACTGFGAYVLVRAARRVESGEDLFARRHRRRPGSQHVEEDGTPAG